MRSLTRRASAGRPFRSRMRSIAVALAAGLLLAPLAGAPSPAVAAEPPIPGGTVQVLDANGTPVVGALITIEAAGSNAELFGVTGAGGTLDLTTIAGFTAAQNPYYLWINADGFAGYWDMTLDQDTSVPITITPGGPTVTATLPTANNPPDATSAGISGRVTDALTGAPLTGILVTANDDGTGGDNQGGGQTALDGTYYVQFQGGALPSTASVMFQSAMTSPDAPFGYEGQFYNGVFMSQPTAENPVPVSAGATTGDINAALRPNGQISGLVTDAGAPLLGASVSIWDPLSQTVVASASTAADGTYAAPVGPGSYIVQVDKIIDGNIVATLYFSGATTYADGRLVEVASKVDTPSIDVAFGVAPPPVTPGTPTPAPAEGDGLAESGASFDTVAPFLVAAVALTAAGAILLTWSRRRSRRMP
ncbi:carboxypeptidase-like regulatory domain-containing protein [Microbacterium sp. 179-I 3D2 NHS]|uniref:carboxypeptidase-like regulatory domain-containing protein n=1 Tax=Microbacterium sp. 179-I 3D2 NHS TaxID=3235178 RepID=UPI0039A00907